MKSSKKKMSKKVSYKKKNSKKLIDKPKIIPQKNIKKHKVEKIVQKTVEAETTPIEEKVFEDKDIMVEKIKETPYLEDVEELPIEPVKIKSEKKTVLKNEDDFVEEKNKVEALLFAHGKYIDESLILELCGIDKRRIKKILEQLRQDYEQKNNALTIFQEGNSWKINVREKYLSIVRKIVADTELPKSVMETLAVIAWKSPIYQSEVVRIRGNKCYDHIEVLEEAGFILKDKKGRSYILKTTDKFYNYFEIDHGNLKSIFEEVKVPIKEEQQTLEDDVKVPENVDIETKIEHISVKRWTETEEEKDSHNKFLEEMDGKLREVKEKNTLLEEELPSPKREVTIITQIPDETENISQENINEQKPVEEQKKPKTLTKKQLEKKFKDDILRVREKMDKK